MQGQRFAGRSVFITGGGSGIGLAAALAFAAEGGWVTIAEFNKAAGEEAVAKITAAGGKALFVATDATDEAAVKAALAAASAAHGPVRHAFNNVGGPGGSSIETTTVEDWERILRLNLTSVFLAMKHEIPMMRAAGGGTIVNTASGTASIFTPEAPPAYSAAKAGVIHLSHFGSCALGKENIRVNSVSPGLTATPLVLNGLPPHVIEDLTSHTQSIPRITRPEEIAAAVLYLSSDDSAMVTGVDLEVGGGRVF